MGIPRADAAPSGGGPAGQGRGRRRLRLAAQLLLTAAVTGFVLDRVGFTFAEVGALDPGRWQLRWTPLVGSVVVLAAGYAFSAWLWARMVVEMGGPPLRLGTAVRVYMVANLGRYVPGKVLQIAGLAWLARREGVAPGTAMGAAVVGQGVALLGATTVGLGAFFGPNTAYRTVGWVGVGLTVAFVIATSVPASARVLERLWRRLASREGRAGGASTDLDATAGPPAPHPGPDAPGTDADPDPAARPGFGLRWTAAYALNWGVYAVAFWLLFLGLEGWTPFLRTGPAFAAAYLVGYLFVFAPAGAGIRESALVVFLLPVLPRDAALALAVAARLWATVVEVVPAAVFAFVQARRSPAAAPTSASGFDPPP